MKNLQALKDDLNYELKTYSNSKVEEITDMKEYNLYALLMTTSWVDKETLDVISKFTGDPNPSVYKHWNNEGIDSRLEVVVEWYNDEELPF